MLGARTPSSAERAQHAKKSKKPVTIVRASRSIAGEGARAPSICRSLNEGELIFLAMLNGVR